MNLNYMTIILYIFYVHASAVKAFWVICIYRKESCSKHEGNCSFTVGTVYKMTYMQAFDIFTDTELSSTKVKSHYCCWYFIRTI